MNQLHVAREEAIRDAEGVTYESEGFYGQKTVNISNQRI